MVIKEIVKIQTNGVEKSTKLDLVRYVLGVHDRWETSFDVQQFLVE